MSFYVSNAPCQRTPSRANSPHAGICSRAAHSPKDEPVCFGWVVYGVKGAIMALGALTLSASRVQPFPRPDFPVPTAVTYESHGIS